MATKRFLNGHVYSIEYDDHWSSERIHEREEDGKAPRLRARGVLLSETRTTIVLEHSRHVLDDDRGNQRVDVHGIIKSGIRRVQHFGREK